MDDLHPTSAEPEVCHVCGRRAIGIALPGGRRDDHKWLCAECYPLLEYVRSVRRWDGYEDRAIDAVDNATGDFAAEHGADIAAMDKTTRRALWRCVLRSHQDGIRAALREGPF